MLPLYFTLGIGIVYCLCGRCLTFSKSVKKLDKKNFDALLIPVTSLQEHTPWCQTGSFCTATNVLQSRGDVAKRSPTGYPSTLERLHDEHVIETSEGNTPIHFVQRQDSEGATNLKDLNKIVIKLILEHYGGLSRSQEICGIQHLHLHQVNGNSTMKGSRTKVGILGDPLLDCTVSFFFQFRDPFSLDGNLNSLAIDGGCRQIHQPHATFSHVQVLHRSHSTDDMCTMDQGRVVRRKRHSFIHA